MKTIILHVVQKAFLTNTPEQTIESLVEAELILNHKVFCHLLTIPLWLFMIYFLMIWWCTSLLGHSGTVFLHLHHSSYSTRPHAVESFFEVYDVQETLSGCVLCVFQVSVALWRVDQINVLLPDLNMAWIPPWPFQLLSILFHSVSHETCKDFPNADVMLCRLKPL